MDKVSIALAIIAIVIAGAAISYAYSASQQAISAAEKSASTAQEALQTAKQALQAAQKPAAISPEEVTITTKHGSITLEELAEIQPGLGTVMMEYSNRFWILYYAAKAGNWDLAKYELKEMREIQEVGETTRPKMADVLKAFEQSYLDPLEQAINNHDWKAFQDAYSKAVQGCNNCHAGTGHPYIKYTLPETPPPLLDLSK